MSNQSTEAQPAELTYYIINRPEPGRTRNVGEITLPEGDDAQNFADAIFAPMVVEAILSYPDQIVEYTIYRCPLVEGKLRYIDLGKHILRRKTDWKAFAVEQLGVPEELKGELGFSLREIPDDAWKYSLDAD